MNSNPLARRTFLALAAATCAAPALSQGPRAGKSLRIATVFDNTGIGRVNGADLYAGSRALVARVNREGGINGMPLEFVMEDDHFDPALTRQKTEALAADASVLAVLHPLGTQQTSAMIQSAADLPIVGPSTGTIGLRQMKASRVFWTRASYADEIDHLLATAKTLAVRTVGLVYPNDPLGQSLLGAFKTACEKHKLELLVAAPTPDTASIDVGAAAKTIAQANPQLVVMGLAAPAPVFVKAFRALNRSSQLFGLSIGASAGSIRAMGDLGRGIGFSIVVPSPTVQKYELVRRYQTDLRANGSTEYSLFGVEGYLSASVLLHALRRAGPVPTRASVQQALEGLNSLDLGGLRVGYGPGVREGNSYVSLAVVGADGRLNM